MAVIARAKVSGLIRPVIWTKVHLSSGDFVRHGKTRSAKTGISVLLEMRRAIPVHHKHVELLSRAHISHVRMQVRRQNLDFREGVRAYVGVGPFVNFCDVSNIDHISGTGRVTIPDHRPAFGFFR
jgi:hypothetical protein